MSRSGQQGSREAGQQGSRAAGKQGFVVLVSSGVEKTQVGALSGGS